MQRSEMGSATRWCSSNDIPTSAVHLSMMCDSTSRYCSVLVPAELGAASKVVISEDSADMSSTHACAQASLPQSGLQNAADTASTNQVTSSAGGSALQGLLRCAVVLTTMKQQSS
jgi:hypothetical protein